MRVLVCGSRYFKDYNLLKEKLDAIGITVLIEGEAEGADRLSAKWAEVSNVHTERFPADWNVHGKRAGPIRNKQMLEEGKPEMVVAFWDGKSKGTKNMIAQARSANVPVEIVYYGL